MATEAHEGVETHYSIFDLNDPRSIINLAWNGLKTRLQNLTEEEKHWFYISENQLWKSVKPEPSHILLRTRFWNEYERCQHHGTNLRQTDVVKGVCSFDLWERKILPSAKHLAFVLTAPQKYSTVIQSLHAQAIEQLGAILEMDHVDKNGKVIPAIIGHKIKVFEMLDIRVKGAIAQKLQIDQRVMTADISQDVLKGMNLNDLQELDASINSVKRQIARAQRQELPAKTETIDVTPTGIPEVEAK